MKLEIAENQRENAIRFYFVDWTKREFSGFLKLAQTGKVKKDGFYYKTTAKYLSEYIYTIFVSLRRRFDIEEEVVLEEQEVLLHALKTMNAKQFSDLVAIIAEPCINLEGADCSVRYTSS